MARQDDGANKRSQYFSGWSSFCGWVMSGLSCLRAAMPLAPPLPSGEKSARSCAPGEGAGGVSKITCPLTPTLSPPEGFAQLISDDSIVTNDSGDLEMVERVVGQLGLADGLVSAPAAQMLDELDAALDWGRLRALLGKRGGAGPGNSSYPAEVLLSCLLLGVWHSLSDPAL